MTESDKAPAVPKGLQSAGRKLWRAAVGDYDLDQHELLLLVQACRTADVLDRLAAESVGARLTVENHKGDLVANPLLTEARQQGIVLARLLAALRLPSGEAGDTQASARPQRRTGVRGVYAPRQLGVVS